MKVGFIGLGNMGKPMAKNAIKAGFDLVVFDINKAAVDEVVAAGATAASSAKEVAEICDPIITMLPNSPHVKAVVMGENGVLEGAAPGKLLVDMSSIAPLASKEIYEACKAKGVRMIDSPVSGGIWGAEQGTLALMIGGDQKDIDEVRPLLESMSGSIVRCGDIGAGSTTKVVNQIICGVELSMLAEAYALGAKAGLDPQVIFNAIRGGGAGSKVMENEVPRMYNRDFTPGFALDLHIKDLRNAMDTAKELGVIAPLTELTLNQFLELSQNQGMGKDDHRCVVKYYEQKDDVVVESKGE